MKFLNFFCLILLSVACIKTADQVQREKRLESMSEQMRDSQGLVADMVTQMKDMQSQIDRLNGRLEELEHRNSQIDPQNLKQMNESMELIKAQQTTQAEQLTAIQNELKEQRAFIEKVTASLSASAKANSGSQKKSAKNELSQGLDLIKADKYADARNALEPLIDHKDLTAGDHNKVLHGLGKVEYYTKNYEKSLVYFSKIFSKFPKSSLAPSSLLFIGRNLKKMGKKDEANEAFSKVVEDYPASAEAKLAKKEL